MNTMTHKGYAARIEYSDEDHCFIGHIAGINDIVGFHGDSVAQLRTAFEEAVEDYLETCEKFKSPPTKALFWQSNVAPSPRSSRSNCHSCRSQWQKHQSMDNRYTR